jgi:hypothetical protein
MRPAVRKRMYVIECRKIELQFGRTVDASAATVSHGGVLYRALVGAGGNLLGPARYARGTGEGDTVKVPTTGHVTSLKRKHPATGNFPWRGVAPISEESVDPETRSMRRSVRGARPGARCRTSRLIRLR